MADNPGAGKVRHLTIDANHAGQRIDNYLLGQLKGVPKSRIYRMLRSGEVRVNKGRIKAGYKLAYGDQVRVPPVRVAERPANAGNAALGERLMAGKLYEDDHLLVINKPSGVAVHGGSGVSSGVIEAVRAARPQLGDAVQLVHRLDRETSGCLLLAKRRATLKALHEMLREGGVEKHYLALVDGRWSGGAVEIDVPLEKNTRRGGERHVTVSGSGKQAVTQLRPLTRYRDATLLDVHLLTGRTHQIRVHCASIEHPLAGDDKYGDFQANARYRKLGLKRLFLHAQRLRFTLPDGPELAFEAPLPDELQRVLDRLEQD